MNALGLEIGVTLDVPMLKRPLCGPIGRNSSSSDQATPADTVWSWPPR